jgi:hypothetical protein
MTNFVREERYIVTKIKTGKQVDCVVVEKDWPEYEIVWKMIQDRVEGKGNEIETLRATLKKAKWMLERDYIDDQKMSFIRECEKALGEE